MKFISAILEWKVKKIISNVLEWGMVLIVLYSIFFAWGNWNMLFSSIINWICIKLFIHVDTKYGFDFPEIYKIFFIIAVISSFMGGHFSKLYLIVPLYDKVQHLIFPAGIVVLVNYMYMKKTDLSLGMRLQVAFFATLSAILFFEFFEFGIDKIFNSGFQGVFSITGDMKQSPINDTMFDLLLGTIGAAIGCFGINSVETRAGTKEVKNVKYNHNNKG